MNAFITEAQRTPIGRSHKDKGFFKDLRADDLLAHLLKDLAQRVEPRNFDDIYIGCVAQHLEQGKNIARLAALLANYPDSVPGVTINRLCGSSLQALNFAATTLESGCAKAIVAGGVEHMHHLPMTSQSDPHKELLSRYEFPFNNMGLTAEKVAEIEGITRSEQDEFALHSHQKASHAQKSGFFNREIIAISIGSEIINKDQGIRPDTSLVALAQLETVFKEKGTVTAGNSSQVSDGASITLLATDQFCRGEGLKKRAQVMGFSVVGLDPTIMGLGPIRAISQLLKQHQMSVQDIDLFEINEAFASQAIACMRKLEIPSEKVNPLGGAIALGHPLGCTGTRLIVTLLHNLERLNKEWGIASMCIGHGQGIATLIRRG